MEEATRSAVLRLGPLARLARAHELGHVAVLPNAEGEAAHQLPRLGPAKVPPERPIMVLAEHLRTHTAASGDAEPVHFTLAPPVQQTAQHQKCPAGWCPRGLEDGCAVPVDGPAERPRRPRMMSPKKASTASSCTKVWTKAGARMWSADGTGVGGAGVVPVPRASSDPARATNILVHGGVTALPLGLGRGISSPS